MFQLLSIDVWVSVSSLVVTQEHLEPCVSERSKVDFDDHDLARIKREFNVVRLEPTYATKNLEHPIWNLCLNYTTTLQNCWYSDVV